MTGKDYIATSELSKKSGEVVARVGETCERVDPTSLPWLLEQGYIQPSKPVALHGKERVTKAPASQSEV